MTESKHQRRERFAAMVAEPEFLDGLCDLVAEGGTLSDFCRTNQVKFRWLFVWLGDSEFPERRAKFIEAETARDALAKEDVIGQLHRLSNIDVRDMYGADGQLLPVHHLPDHIAKAVASIDVIENEKGDVTKKVRFVDRGQMLALSGRRQKMFVDRTELAGQLSLEEAVAESLNKSRG